MPEYVDTKTPAWKWYGYNLLIFVLSLTMAYLASLVVEYDLARLLHPDVSFIATPLWPGLLLAALTMILAGANLAVLLFVLLRHLWLRYWMISTTLAGWVCLAIIVLLFQRNFIPILFP